MTGVDHDLVSGHLLRACQLIAMPLAVNVLPPFQVESDPLIVLVSWARSSACLRIIRYHVQVLEQEAPETMPA
jgi:hypothetical protein